MIDHEKYYSAKQITDMKILPWNSNTTFTKALREQKWIDIFKPITEVKSNHTRFYIQGKNIIKFKELADNGNIN